MPLSVTKGVIRYLETVQVFRKGMNNVSPELDKEVKFPEVTICVVFIW